MERIGIFGGTFDPPHSGHIQAARQAIATLELDRLLLVPAGTAPNKQERDITPASHRLRMLETAVQALPRAGVWDWELRQEGVSYTYLTVRQLREEFPGVELFLILGSDRFLLLPQWRNADEILSSVTVAVLRRGAQDTQEAAERLAVQLQSRGARVSQVPNAAVPISSTDVKRMLAFGCADPLLPEGVGDYIRAHGLYGVGRDCRNLPMDQLEEVVVSLLNPNRVAHVLGCRDTAVEMARRWGADETDAARAGILHDITKALDGPLQLTLCQEYGTILDTFFTQNPKTLHALTGSLVAERIFGENPRVVSAIRSHTTGKANMTALEKIIYVADYMEPNRDFPGVEQLRALAFSDLDGALRLGLEMTMALLRRSGSQISPESQDALAWLNRQ